MQVTVEGLPVDCEVEYGEPVEPCGALIRTEEVEGYACDCCDDGCDGWEPSYTREHRCQQVPGHAGAHNEHGRAMIWHGPDMVFKPGVTYSVRVRCLAEQIVVSRLP